MGVKRKLVFALFRLGEPQYLEERLQLLLLRLEVGHIRRLNLVPLGILLLSVHQRLAQLAELPGLRLQPINLCLEAGDLVGQVALCGRDGAQLAATEEERLLVHGAVSVDGHARFGRQPAQQPAALGLIPPYSHSQLVQRGRVQPLPDGADAGVARLALAHLALQLLLQDDGIQPR
eukprot:scaffold1615_cov103-Isochrysis_galbana.AAC.7